MQIDSKLSKASFDATVEGTVISVEDADLGKYLVQIQNAKFEAYSQSGSYYEGDKVYINIPRNDYSLQKFIVGRKASVDDDDNYHAFNFRYPFDDFIALQTLSDSEGQVYVDPDMDTEDGIKYTANKPEDGCAPDPLLSDLTQDKNIVWYWQRPAKQSLVGSTLGIQMNWQSFLGEYEPSAGDYGLRFLVRGTQLIDKQAKENVLKEYFFKTADMYGNPYTFYSKYTQQALLNLSGFSTIDEIVAFFWQDHNFLDVMGERIPVTDAENLILSDLKVQFGLSVQEIENEKIYLFTYDSLSFGEDAMGNETRDQLDKRTINFAWVHKTGDKEFTVINNPNTLKQFNDQIEDDEKKAHIYWYRQTRSGDTANEGVPYIAPGATQPELEKRYADLKTEFEEKLKSIEEAKDTYASESAYTTAREALINHYNHSLEYVKKLIEDEKALKDSRKTTYAGYDYSYLPDYDDKFSIEQVLDIQLYRERFKAVIAWEGTYEVSEPIVFQNVNSEIANNLAAANNEVIFRLLRTETYKDSQNVTQTRLVEDNSIGNFYVYDENNNVIKNDEEVYYSDVYYYIQIWIYSYEQEQYVPLIPDDTDETFSIAWTAPTKDTMIKEFTTIDANDQAYNSDLIPSGPEAFSNAQAITRKFKIDSFWNLRYSDNIITAAVMRNGKKYICQQLLQFGQSGSTGSKFTLRVNLVNPASYMMLIEKPFDIEATIYDQTGKKKESSTFTFKYTLLNDGPCIITPTSTASIDGISKWTSMSSNGYAGNSIHGVLRSNYPPIFKVSCDLHDGDTRYEIEHIQSFMCAGSVEISENYAVGCPNRIEYKSDGTIPYYDSSEFEVVHIATQKHIYPTWELDQFQKSPISGIFNKVPNNLIEYVRLDEEFVDEVPINPGTEDPETKANQEEAASDGYYIYKLNPYLNNENELRDQIAFFWEDDMVDKTATFIRCYINGHWVCQAIAFAHNVYASSLLNSWDGQLLIDKENNAVLAKMISAGTKDTRNRFTGVIMGDWADKGDASIDPVGLYGFSHGTQTFGFKTDGTGFIGAAGHGQIKFDGTRALISDYTRNHYINLNPQYYSVDENGLLTVNSGSYSQYFLYAKNKKLEIDATLAENQNAAKYGWINTSWADIFRNDPDSDYFVVDPTNGVYMSGGVIARYGMIGDCLQLSSCGLTYQKNNGIIYIGQERTRDGQLIGEDDDDIDYDEHYWDSSSYTDYDFSGSNPNKGTNSSEWGRYIFWAGDADDATPGIPINPYPNFGIEHNGTVHLNNAYVQGEIHATSLQIGMPDGAYHDVRERLAATYYNDNNPANIKSNNGICATNYGDMLLKGDVWYDTSTEVDLNSITSYSVTGSTNMPPVGDDAPTGPSDDPDNPLAGAHTTPAAVATEGYRVCTWSGSKFSSSTTTHSTWRQVDGKWVPPDGWELQPALAADTLSFMNTYTAALETSLSTLQSAIVDSVNTSYNSIRRGMTPLAFFTDGSCYVSISSKATSNIGHNIGSAPAGIAIYQLDNNNNFNGSSFYVNGKRMGFYQRINVAPSGQPADIKEIPLLAYYDGNMALAGSMLLGLDVTKATIAQNDTGFENLGLYINKIDGQKGELILGNGAIELKSGLNASASTIEPSLSIKEVTYKVGETTHTAYPKITLGGLNSRATIQMAGYTLYSITDGTVDQKSAPAYSSTSSTLAGQQSGRPELTLTATTFNFEATTNTVFNITYNTGTAKAPTSSTLTDLHKFGIYESGQTNDPGFGIFTKPNCVVFSPYSSSSSNEYYKAIAGWDFISTKKIFATVIDTEQVLAKEIYAYTKKNIDGVEHYYIEMLATQKWVADYLSDLCASLSAATATAQGTANNALGFARGHTHKYSDETDD